MTVLSREGAPTGRIHARAGGTPLLLEEERTGRRIHPVDLPGG